MTRFSPIAVIGVSAIFPGSNNKQGFWKDIISGKDLVTDVPRTHWLIEDYYDPDPKIPDKTYCKRGAFLQDIDFDPMEYGIPPSIVPATDSTQLLALIATKQLLLDLKPLKKERDLSHVSVICGITSAQEAVQYMTARLQYPVWKEALRRNQLDETKIDDICATISTLYSPWQENTFPGLLGNVVAGRLCNRFNFGGTNCVVDAACASSLAGLLMGVSELQLHRSDMVICGGADTLNDIFMYMCFSKTPAMSFSGDCRPFSSDSDGTILGEGLGFFALKRLEDAEADGEKIYAVIKGIGTSSDGRSKSVYAPTVNGQFNAIVRAYEQAGYSADSVDLIEAHGTATAAGDSAEFAGLNKVFEHFKAEKIPHCALGSIKSQIGHTKAAAGAASLFKAVYALHNKILPPTIKIKAPNPEFDIKNSPFYLNTQAIPWLKIKETPRRAGVSSFGFGGSNFHVTLEEYSGPLSPLKSLMFHSALLVFSADSPKGLLDEIASVLAQTQTAGIDYLASQTQKNYAKNKSCRLAVTANSIEELSSRLEYASQYIKSSPDQPLLDVEGISYNPKKIQGKVAFVFPGEGTQYLNMGKDLALLFNSALDTWDFAMQNSQLKQNALNRRVFPISCYTEDDLRQANEQLNLAQNAQPAIVITHLIYKKLLDLVCIKADAVAGYSLGELSALHYAGCFQDASLIDLSIKHGEESEINNYLSNCSVQSPQVTVYRNQQQTPYPADILAIKSSMASLKDNPTLFAEMIKNMQKDGIQVFVEIGPKAILAPLINEILLGSEAQILSLDIKNTDQLGGLWYGLGRLFVLGINPEFQHLWQEFEEPEVPVPVSDKKRLIMKINGTCYGKPYPTAEMIQNKEGRIVHQERPADQSSREHSNIMNNKYDTQHHEVSQSLADEEFIKTCQMFQEQLLVLQKEMIDTLQTVKGRLEHHAVTENKEQMSQKKPDNVLSPSVPKTDQVASPIPSNPAINPVKLERKLDDLLVSHQQPIPVFEAIKPAPVQVVKAEQPKVQETVTSEASSQNTKTHALMLAIVSEKTGYPENMLEPHMNLEADLGIDSIKRVEILSAMKDQMGGLSELDPTEMVQLNTIAEVVNYINKNLQKSTDTVSPAPTNTNKTEVQSDSLEQEGTEAMEDGELKKILLDTVSAKTGYPVDLIDFNMELEADLGIDSIKRVEILSALKESYPDLAELDPAEMVKLSTLGSIMDYVNQQKTGIKPNDSLTRKVLYTQSQLQ